MNIYLDVDGVLLDYNLGQMPYLREFVKSVFDLAGDSVYWLTTYCKDGSTDAVLNHLGEILDSDIHNMLKRVKPTKWDTLKTEGIDLDSEFLWFDDNIFNAEYRVLEEVEEVEETELIEEAKRLVVNEQKASASFLQRKFRIGYNRAARLMDRLEALKVISKEDGTKPRKVLIKEV